MMENENGKNDVERERETLSCSWMNEWLVDLMEREGKYRLSIT
jgi:hypothetical protein